MLNDKFYSVINEQTYAGVILTKFMTLRGPMVSVAELCLVISSKLSWSITGSAGSKARGQTHRYISITTTT